MGLSLGTLPKLAGGQKSFPNGSGGAHKIQFAPYVNSAQVCRMTAEGLKVSLVENGIAGLSATGTKPVLVAAAFVGTFLKSLRAGFVQKLVLSRIGRSFGAADEDTDEDCRVRYLMVLKAAAAMGHILQPDLYGSPVAHMERA